jgi:hypothetical protein
MTTSKRKEKPKSSRRSKQVKGSNKNSDGVEKKAVATVIIYREEVTIPEVPD